MEHKLLTFAGFILIAASSAHAQQESAMSPIQRSPEIAAQEEPIASAQEAQRQPSQSTIRTYVNLVSTPLVVRNRKGELVLDLSEKDLRVSDNGVHQTLEDFEIGGAPFSLVIVVENSTRISELLPALRRSGSLFTRAVLGEGGEAAVVAYDEEVIQLLDFTSEDDAVRKTLGDLDSGTSGAHLYDALFKAVSMLRKLPPSRRRVIIALAEAYDTGSAQTLSRVVKEAQIADIAIYSVGLSTVTAEVRRPPQQAAPPLATPPGTYSLPTIPGSANTPTLQQLYGGNMDLGGAVLPIWAFVGRKPPLEEAVAATGGLYLSTGGYTSIEMAIDQIAGELTAQYTLSYRRTGGDTPGFHQIKVQVVGRRSLKVRTRPGYYLLQP